MFVSVSHLQPSATFAGKDGAHPSGLTMSLSFLLVSLQFLFISVFASRAFASHFHSSLTFVYKAGAYPSGLTISPHTHTL